MPLNAKIKRHFGFCMNVNVDMVYMCMHNNDM